jgi:2-C-methyl-D-erythritol 2,4-cyclodiphosphate synthase
MNYRTGIGYDIHRLIEGRKLILGGIEIPYIKGLLGHSDGDALLHAITDALLGAAGKDDIGQLFPDTDPKYYNADSKELLRQALQLVLKDGWKIDNVDAVIIAQEPRLAPFKKEMRKTIAQIMGIEQDAIGLKGKTAENMGEIGKKEAIACMATVLLHKGG